MEVCIGYIKINKVIVCDFIEYRLYWIIFKYVWKSIDRVIIWVYGWSFEFRVGLVERE